MIKYILGDATEPVIKDGTRIITHVCNDIGKWGKGFVLAISKKWKKPEQVYRSCHNYRLGDIQVVNVGGSIQVVNMIGQRHIYPQDNIPPIRYEAIEQCFKNLMIDIDTSCNLFERTTVHMPRIGCGLAGGEWWKIEKIIHNSLIEKNIPVYVYDKP